MILKCKLDETVMTGLHRSASDRYGLLSKVSGDFSQTGMTNASDTCLRNLHKYRALKIWRKFISSYFPFNSVHNDNWPANHVAWFVSRARQFLSWNRAVLICMQETWKRLTDTCASFLYKTTCTSFWYKFLERVSPALDEPHRFPPDQ